MKISYDEVSHVASLARLELSKEEKEHMVSQLDQILGYVDTLSELDTEGIQPTTHALAVCNAFREDVIQPSLSRETALQNGPQQNGEAFVVPKVI